MKIVIDIHEKDYQAIKNGHIPFSVLDVIMNGTPLPKGHGRLGDLDALKDLCTEHEIANSAFDGEPMIEDGYYSDGDCIWKPLFDLAPTIIEGSDSE